MNIPFFDKFPVDVLVLQKRGSDGGLMWYRDKGRFRRKGTEEYYELKKNHKKLKPPSYNFMIPGSKGKPMVVLYEYARDMYVPVDVAHLEQIPERDVRGDIVMEDFTGVDGSPQIRPKILHVVNLKAADEDMSQWAGVFRRQCEEKYRKKSFLDKYGFYLMAAMMMVTCFVLAYLFMGAIASTGQDVVGALNAVAARMGVVTPG